MLHSLVLPAPAVCSGRCATAQEVHVFPAARVPVIKLRVPGAAATAADITINNVLPLHNTELLRAYSAADDRVRSLLFLVKHWAKCRGLNDTYRGTLSSYAWCLMAVFVAQRAGIAPVLQQRSSGGDGGDGEAPDVDCSVAVEGIEYRVVYSRSRPLHRDDDAAREQLTLGALLTMFFDYFAFRCARRPAWTVRALAATARVAWPSGCMGLVPDT
jgi:DNA polymerase sigma